jgi:hypothetical protein
MTRTREAEYLRRFDELPKARRDEFEHVLDGLATTIVGWARRRCPSGHRIEEMTGSFARQSVLEAFVDWLENYPGRPAFTVVTKPRPDRLAGGWAPGDRIEVDEALRVMAEGYWRKRSTTS